MFAGMMLKNSVAFPVGAFAFTVNTSNPGSSGSNQFTYPTISSGTYNCTVHWGDGTTSNITTYNDAAWTHTYSTPGTYTAYITGTFYGFCFTTGSSDRLKLLNIAQWGTLRLIAAGNHFYACANMTITATDILDLTGTTSLFQTFNQCSLMTTIPNITSWDFSGITNLAGTWENAIRFNSNLNGINISAVTTMNATFNNASLFNGTCGSLNVGNVTDFTDCFNNADAFQQNINSWNMSSATKTIRMFSQCNYNQPIGSWVTTALQHTDRMFQFNAAFNQPLNSWNVTNLLTATFMFDNSVFNQSLSGWTTTNLQDTTGMFSNSPYNQAISFVSTNIATASQMFQNATSFNSAISTAFINCQDFSYFLDGATSFNKTLNSLDLTQCLTFDYMLRNATSYQQNMITWNPSNIGSAVGMCNGITLTNANYNSLLVAFDTNAGGGQGSVTFSGGNSHYDATSGGYNGLVARASLIITDGWTITDGGTP